MIRTLKTSLLLASVFAALPLLQLSVPLNARQSGSATAPAEGQSVLNWMTEEERAAAVRGDLSIDLTAAFQRAVASGVHHIDLQNHTYRIDGRVDLPRSGIKLTGNGWTAKRGPRVKNNGGRMFSAIHADGDIILSGGNLIGNVTRGGPGYDPLAAGLYVEDIEGGIELRDMSATGFAVGAYVRYVNGLTVLGGRYSGNALSGLSGFANDVLVDGARFEGNGFTHSRGLTHDLYLINGTGGTIRNSYFGDHLDRKSSSLALRYDKGDAKRDFDQLSGWRIYGNVFSGNGVRVGSDSGVPWVERKPPSAIRVYENSFRGPADLRFDDPEDVYSHDNIGIENLIIGVASTYPGYKVGFHSDRDMVAGILQNAVALKRFESRDGVQIRSPEIMNGNAAAVSEIRGFGGYVAFTLDNPRVRGAGQTFDKKSSADVKAGLIHLRN